VLPSELARFKISGDKIVPLFAGKPHLDLIEEMLSLYKPGRTLGEVEEDVKLLERAYGKTTKSAKLVRGIHRVIMRHLDLSGESPLDPRRIRSELFSAGPALTAEERARRISEVSERLGINAEKYMYSDMEESKVIRAVNISSPEEVIKEYNLSLLQTILFKSYKVTFTLSGNWKEFIRTVKRLGLMYFAYPNPVRVEVMGPYTLLKPSEKYGRNLALLVPYAVSAPTWRIEAEVILGKRNRRVYSLELGDFDLISSTYPEGKNFDSSVEEDFFWAFRRVAPDWRIEREPGPIVVNGRIFLPDFAVEKDGLRVFLEIVGFWTEEYLKEKVSKLKSTNVPLLVIVNEETGSGKIMGLPVVTYRRKIDAVKVYSKLKEMEGLIPSRPLDYSLDGSDVIPIKELAAKYNVSEQTLRKNLKEFPGYVLLRNYYVREDLLEKLSKEDFTGMSLQDLVSKYGEFIADVLERLGYKVKWKSITEAIVVK
jgi:Uncharacterized conserved protein